MHELNPIFVVPPSDVKLSLENIYAPQVIRTAQLAVFKFAATHYLTVMQRASDKQNLPNMVKYLKAYMNEDVECAKWFLQQFTNVDILKETLLDSCEVYMRTI